MQFQFYFENPLEVVPSDHFVMVVDWNAFEQGFEPKQVIKKDMTKQIPLALA